MAASAMPVPWLVLLPLLAAYFLDYMDGSYFNGVFRALEVDMRLNIYHLTIMQGSTGLAAMIFGPMWALLVDRRILSRKTLLVLGSAGWGFTSLLMSNFARDFSMLLSLRFVCTAFLCSGAPIAQSIIGGSVAPEMRGRCFSYLAISGSVAMILTSHFSTALSEQEVFWTPSGPVAGWRFGLALVGVLSLLFAAVTSVTMKETSLRGADDDHLGSVNMLIAFRNLRDHWKLRSFRLLCILGSCWSFSWQVMIFSTLYFQYLGLSNWHAGMATACWHLGDLVANLGGGPISDALHRRYSLRGRLYLAQGSLTCTLPVLFGIFVVLPRYGVVSGTPYAALMFLFGLSTGSCVAAVNKPLLSQIAPAPHIASIMAWEQTLENAIGAVWAPAALLGLMKMADYLPASMHTDGMPGQLREHNANALAFIILSFTTVAYTCTIAGYTALHWTISQDLAECDDKLSINEKTSLLNGEVGCSVGATKCIL